VRSAWRWANRGLVPGKTGRARWGVGETCWAAERGSAKRKRGGCWAAGVWAGAGEKEMGRVVLGLGYGFLFYFFFFSISNSNKV